MTGLALALACGGSDESEPVNNIVSPTVVTPPVVIVGTHNGVGLHHYEFKLLQPNASEFAVSNTTTAPTSGWQSSPTFHYQVPNGTTALYFFARSGSVTSKFEKHDFNTVDNSTPEVPGKLNVNAVVETDIATITLPSSDQDGDTVTWTAAATPTGFPGTVTFDAAKNTVTVAVKDAKEADYKAYSYTINSKETHKPEWSSVDLDVATKTHTISINLGDHASEQLNAGGGPGSGVVYPSGYYGSLDYNPGEAQTAVVGIPEIFHFEATVRAPGGAVAGTMPNDWVTWNFPLGGGTAGLGNWNALKANDDTRHKYSWVSTEYGPEHLHDVEALGPKFAAWAKHHKDTAHYWVPGTLFVLPEKAYLDYVPDQMHFGVAALFGNTSNGLIGQGSFRLKEVTENTPPTVGTLPTVAYEIEVFNTVDGDKKWPVNKYTTADTGEDAVVFKAADSSVEQSMDLSATLSFSVSAVDTDRNDVLTAYLDNIYAAKSDDGSKTTTSIKDQLKGKGFFDATTEELFEKTASIEWTATKNPASDGKFEGVIKFDKVPLTGSITWGTDGENVLGENVEYAYFTFKGEDMGFNPFTFDVKVKFRGNTAPILDAYDPDDDDWVMTSGDDKAWISGTASQNSPTSWKINWADPETTPTKKRLSDEHSDPTFLEIKQHIAPDANLTISPDHQLLAPGVDNEWIVNWNKPLEQHARTEYTYTIGGWDKYGAATENYDMSGLVWGSIYGTPVAKNIYLTEYVFPPAGSPVNTKGTVVPGTATELADFANKAWARVKVDFFYGHKAFIGQENKAGEELYHTYASDINFPVVARGGNIGDGLKWDNSWTAEDIPPVNYLVSAHYLDGNDQRINKPIIGPAVTSTNLKFAGSNWGAKEAQVANWPGGNAAVFAWLSKDSLYPDLTANVGANIMAGYLDKTLNDKLRNQQPELDEAYVDARAGGYSTLIDEKPFEGAFYPDNYAFNLGANIPLKQLAYPGPAIEPYLSYWGTFFNYTPGVEATTIGQHDPLRVIGASTKYNGKMNRVLSSVVLNGAKDAIQFSFPTVGQNAFFSISNTPHATDIYPVTHYPMKTPSWLAKLGQADAPYTEDASGLSIDKITFELNNVLPFWVSDGEPLTLSTMVRSAANGTSGTTGTDVVSYPYYRMETTGVTWTGDRHHEIKDGQDVAMASTNWYPVDSDNTFNLTINRLGFMTNHRLALPYTLSTTTPSDWSTGRNARDTFRVLAYTSGTELGHDENHHGLPVFIELGDLNRQAETVLPVTGTGTTWSAGLKARNYNFGTFVLPKPNPEYWDAGLDIPVATYLYNYEDKNTGAMGSQGYVKEVTPNSTLAVAPLASSISGLRITNRNDRVTATKAYNSTPAVRGAGNTALWPAAKENDASEYIITYNPDATGYTSDGDGNIPATIVTAHMHPATIGGQPKVWLIWNNPTEYSGHIFDFYQVGVTNANGTGAVTTPVDADDPPLYRVHMGKGLTEFPIPDSWLATLGAAGTNVVIRARTVKYGEGEDVLNFDETPFLKALPAQWTDVLSTRVNFVAAAGEQNLTPKYLPPVWRAGLSWIDWTPKTVTAFLPAVTTEAGHDNNIIINTVGGGLSVTPKGAGAILFVNSDANYGAWGVEAGGVDVSPANAAVASTATNTNLKLNIPQAAIAAIGTEKVLDLTSGNITYDSEASLADKQNLEITVNLADLTSTTRFALATGTGDSKVTYSSDATNVITYDLYTPKAFPGAITGLTIGSASEFDTWPYTAGTSYTMEWEVTGAKVAGTAVTGAVALIALQGELTLAGSTSSFAANNIKFDAHAWEVGDYIDFKVELKSPYPTNPVSKAITFKVNIVDTYPEVPMWDFTKHYVTWSENSARISAPAFYNALSNYKLWPELTAGDITVATLPDAFPTNIAGLTYTWSMKEADDTPVDGTLAGVANGTNDPTDLNLTMSTTEFVASPNSFIIEAAPAYFGGGAKQPITIDVVMDDITPIRTVIAIAPTATTTAVVGSEGTTYTAGTTATVTGIQNVFIDLKDAALDDDTTVFLPGVNTLVATQLPFGYLDKVNIGTGKYTTEWDITAVSLDEDEHDGDAILGLAPDALITYFKANMVAPDDGGDARLAFDDLAADLGTPWTPAPGDKITFTLKLVSPRTGYPTSQPITFVVSFIDSTP